MARFLPHKKGLAPSGLLLSLCLFFLLLLCFLFLVNGFLKDSQKRQKEALENAIHRSIVYCYTLEGRYPESLEYIKEHYGLVYNEDLFYVDYRPLGANILPDVTILKRNH